ncbi:flagella basal body P-ring formation protein FlgA [Bifidobacterium sp. ESL0728]|uniref:SAF domain-containing protein n=1 Tax=Bifidobacterium sp. ESL0728 TaxID=2983220 RepID=UPI0023F94772|nr:SAF domain-containing protein [Bifidobacterium sp. ESL0728]WEV59402.1 flagella basal body P-ring formation protein FlgA [Bifidobacterium sp. ESL0728]
MNLFHNGDKQSLSVKKPTLKQRRTMRQTRTVLAALCVGLAVFFALQSISSSIATKTAVTAVHTIKRGRTIRAEDLKTVQIADSPALANVFGSDSDVKGLVAQVDIEAGNVIARPMARASPVIGHGLTSIDVKLSGSTNVLIPGDKVSLVGSTGCGTVPNPPAQNPSANQQPEADSTRTNPPDEGNPKDGEAAEGQAEAGESEGDPNGDSGATSGEAMPGDEAPKQSDGQTCTLVRLATVTGNPHRDDGGNVTTQLAMPPQDAARIMAVQERMPIMAAEL